MKAITVYQPWAQLLAIGAKKYETRGWATQYRGPIAIHAGMKSFDKTLDELFLRIEGVTAAEMNFLDAIRRHFPDDPFLEYFPYGAIIATAELVGCYKIMNISDAYKDCGCSNRDPVCDCKLEKDPNAHIVALSDQDTLDGLVSIETIAKTEILFGDWTPGRYVWEIANVNLLPEPIPARGKQGLFNIEGEIYERIHDG